MGRHRAPRRAPTRLVVLVGVLAYALVAVGAGGTESGWAAATVTNSVNGAQTGALAITHTYNSTSCVTTARTANAACNATLGTTATPTATRSDTITNNSTVAVTQSVTGASCGPVQFANVQANADPMLPRNAVAFQQTDKWGTTSAATFSGSGYATDIVGAQSSGLLGLLGNSYSMGVWFNPVDTSGGGIISLDTSLSNTSSATGNPMVWLDSSDKLNFSASSTLGTITGKSTNAYTSGWHLAVLTVNTSGLVTLTKTVTLYVDGAQVAQSSGLTLLSSSASGYWHLGWADFTGVTAPTSSYFHGSLSGAFVNTSTALSSAQVSSLYSAGSASAYQTALAAQSGIAGIWMLGDNGYTTYTGTITPTNIASPCSKVNIALAFTNPAASVGPASLSNFANGSANAAGSLPVGASQSLTITMTQGTGYNSDLTGLHLYVPLTFTYGISGTTSWNQTMTWSGSALDVFWA